MLLESDSIETPSYDHITAGIASPEKIREWSNGEVLRPETINYRTLRAEKDGLFCERIFGTTRDWECFCGKFKSYRYRGVVCDRCGIKVTSSRVRRERMGHIELSSQVAHIWFYRAVPSRIGLFLGLDTVAIKSIIYFEKYVVVDPGSIESLSRNMLLSDEDYQNLRYDHGSEFTASTGAEAIRMLLESLDMDAEIVVLRQKVASSKVSDRRRLLRLRLLESFVNSSNRPEWMVLKLVPVIPPEIRPMVQLDGGRFATSDLNDLYRRLINRNNRLKKLSALKAPDIIIKNEKRMLQESVDALFDNARKKKSVKGAGSRPLKSLSDVLKGKSGRFRQNLLGKRVDYSGRSVIVVGPELRLHQCGIPRKMAIELFKPFIMRRLVQKKLVYNIKSAKRVIDGGYPEVRKILEDVVKEHPILLNRAPTLHRLGIQAFEPVLTDFKAIRLHPLVCAAYNADFDGDQMAVHLPLTAEAQIEAWTLMLSSLNILDPANGRPIVNPSQDMVLGVYALTSLRAGGKGDGKIFASFEEAHKAFEAGFLDLQSPIKVRQEDSNGAGKLVDTSLGRIIFSGALPAGEPWVTFIYKEKDLKTLVSRVFLEYGNYAVVVMLDKIKEMGFKYATYFGITISVGDIIVPLEKDEIIQKARKEILQIQKKYQDGLITSDERYQRTISTWTFTNDLVTEKMMTTLEKDQNGHNDLFIMMQSGARGSKQQVRQLAGMRGLMAKPSGEIMELPVVSNFKEGLGILEYFISTHGARKGLSDTALKTADAGYLTRRIVDVAQDVVVELDDCATINGIYVSSVRIGDQVVDPLYDKVMGQYAAEDIVHPYTEAVLVSADEYVDHKTALLLDELEVERVKIRSVVVCDSPRGVCRKCYGLNLATGKEAEIGEAVGVIASQSIGQPGTQLTMRTFHIGGTASSEVRDPEFKLHSDSVILSLPRNLIVNEEGKLVAPRRGVMELSSVVHQYKLSAFDEIYVTHEERVRFETVIGMMQGKKVEAPKVSTVYINEKNDAVFLIRSSYRHILEVGTVLQKGIGDFISAGEVIYEFDPINEPILSEIMGVVRYQDIVLNKTLKQELDELTGVVNKRILDSKEEQLQPKLVIVSQDGSSSVEVDLPAGTVLRVEDNQSVKTGQFLAGKLRHIYKTSDITGGLPRVQELLEARSPSVPAVLAGIDGYIEIGGTHRGKREIRVVNKYGDKVVHNVPSGKALLVRNGDFVQSMEPVCEGVVDPHDISKVQGEIAVYEYILNNVQDVYRKQGVLINDKHIAVIVRQMMRKVEILDSGDTPYIKGEQVDKYRLRQENKQVAKEGGQPATAVTILLGLTKASLRTESFISSASFQETTKVLTDAAIKNSVDDLRGLKENVIVGRKIPAGTGKDRYENLVIYKNLIGDLDFGDMSQNEYDKDNVRFVAPEQHVSPDVGSVNKVNI